MSPQRRPAAWPALALLVVAACSDQPTPPTLIEPTPAPLNAMACRASVTHLTVSCASLGATGANRTVHILGGQGLYVRLASTGVSYAGGTFAFSVTVQNLSNLAFATTDGSTRHDDGVRVFFHTAPFPTAGSGTITVDNETGTGTFTAAGQPYFQYGGDIGGTDQPELGADGILSSNEVSSEKAWSLSVPGTVSEFEFVLYVTMETPAGSVSTVAPQVTSISPDSMRPGESVTLTGYNFHATPASNFVTVDGVEAAVTGGSGTTSLTITVPCVLSNNGAAVQVTQSGMKGVALAHPLVTPKIDLDEGQAAVMTTAADSDCNEITADGATSDYIVTVVNTASSPLSTTSFQLSSDAPPPVGPVAARQTRQQSPMFGPPPGLLQRVEMARMQQEDALHYRLLEANREAYQRLRTRFGPQPRSRAPGSRSRAMLPPPPAVDTFRISDVFSADICDNSFEVPATRVYYSGRIAIYEDDNNTITAGGNATLAALYDSIGDQYNADMDSVVKTYFSDPLLRDDVTDDNDVLVALFTEIVNDSFPGIAGFVVSCDQYPNGAGNTASNFGEFFYALVPTSVAPGYASSSTMDSWYWSIRATFVHEVKHIAAQARRVFAGAASFESSWLEEGLARHAEELWARDKVYNVPWKGNTGYGSSGSPGSLYCDYRRTDAACLATDPARPSLNMFRHFQGLTTFMGAPADYSPFGATSFGGSSFYATSWSLIRYTADRYGASEADFFGDLTLATTTGTTTLTAAAGGVSISELLGGWSLALYADDYPGLTGATAAIDMPTWNFTSIYAGLNADFPGTFPTVYPLAPTSLPFGGFSPISETSIAGGGAAYFRFSGTHATPQLINLQADGGGTPSSTLRVAVARLQGP